MKENNKLDSEKSNQLAPSQRNASGGFAFGKLLAGLVAAGVLGGGLFGGNYFKINSAYPRCGAASYMGF